MDLGLHLIDTPTGRWTFVGRVPVSLITDNDEVKKALAHCGETIARKCAERLGARFTTSYATKEEAETALKNISCD